MPLLLAMTHSLEQCLKARLGQFSPIGKLPLTLPKNSKVIHAVQMSRNDVPGYDKDKYMREGINLCLC